MSANTDMQHLSLDEMDSVTGGAGAGLAVATGSFSSNSGTKLNILVNWSAYDIGGGQRKLEISVAATSYSLTSSALYNGVLLTVNGAQYVASSAAINYQGSTLTTTPLASFTVQVPAGSVSLAATWNFKGSYSGMPLENITATGTANV